jgi:hypothetical protein
MRHVLGTAVLLSLLACSGGGSRDVTSTNERAASMEAAPVYAACGTPIIDGVLSPGEWDDAVTVRFAAALPELTNGPGAVVPAEVRAMSDDENLYVSFRVLANTQQFAQSHTVELDADDDGTLSAGDDALVYSWDGGGGGSSVFADDYRVDCVVDGHPAVCGPKDTEPLSGDPGTSDGGASIGFGEDRTTVEMWHPYTGADPHDVLRVAGQSIAILLSIRLVTVCDVDVNEWPAAAHCFGDTYFPAPASGDLFYRPFVLGCGAPPPDQEVVEVHIDVKPGDELPTVQLGSEGSTSVAVLGSEAFDVVAIDPATVWFAGAPVELTGTREPKTSLEDVNGDGRPDFVARFVTARLELAVGDAEATLAGRTRDGKRFHGTDVIRVIAP